MHRKLKNALKDIYRPPAPQDKERFLRQLEAQQFPKSRTFPLFFRRHAALLRRWTAGLCAALVLAVGYGIYNVYTDGRQQLEVTQPQTVTEAQSEAPTTSCTSEAASSVTQTVTAVKQTSSSTAVSSQKASDTVPAAVQSENDLASSASAASSTAASPSSDDSTAAPVVTTISPQTTAPKASSITAAATTVQTKTTRQTVPSSGSQTTACTEVTKTTSTAHIPHDYTVQPSNRYTPMERYLTITDFIDSMQSLESEVLQELPRATELSTAIVSGQVQEVLYTSIDGKPWTQVNLVLEQVFRSDGVLEEGDTISIYMEGGYLPLADYMKSQSISPAYAPIDEELISQYSFFWSADTCTFPKVGDTMLFFLKAGDGTVPDGAYVRCVENDSAQYTLQDGVYANTRYDSKLTFSVEELLAKLDDETN